VTQFDLTMTVVASEGGRLAGTLSYRTDLFDAATIDRMLGHYRTLLQAVVDDPGRRIASLPLLTDSERQQVLTEWNGTPGTIDPSSWPTASSRRRPTRTPEAVALTLEGDLADPTANSTRRPTRVDASPACPGAWGPEVLVGFCVERSPAMLVGLLGVLKGRRAYSAARPD
jgi:non-ribosomal peptide synthetase component F